VIVAGFDTATAATAAAVLLDDGSVRELRHDPAPDERPGHAAHLLPMVERVLADAGLVWPDVGRLAVGVGPGGFTGLRIGIATARGIAQAAPHLELVAVSTLQALAAPHGGLVAAVLDARRGEAYVACWRDGEPSGPVAALAPERLGELEEGLLAVGDGAVRFRAHLERAGATVPPDASPVHRVSAAQICRLGAAGRPVARDALVPDYVREPDAKPP
jgi:tRNA threonylcarbamoyladenosine biosynthesis protein TsaB